jgi:hypothetical protein
MTNIDEISLKQASVRVYRRRHLWTGPHGELLSGAVWRRVPLGDPLDRDGLHTAYVCQEGLQSVEPASTANSPAHARMTDQRHEKYLQNVVWEATDDVRVEGRIILK